MLGLFKKKRKRGSAASKRRARTIWVSATALQVAYLYLGQPKNFEDWAEERIDDENLRELLSHVYERMFAFAPDVPIIVLTDVSDESLGVTTVQGGAQDYLVKDEVTPGLLARAVRHAIERHQLLSALRSLSLIDDLTGLYNRR